MPERTPNSREQEAVDGLTAALELVANVHGYRIPPLGDAPSDLVLETDRVDLGVVVKSKPSSEAIWAAIGRWQTHPIHGVEPILVAEWLSSAATQALQRARWSWYDRRRGHLHLDCPSIGLHMDRELPASERTGGDAPLLRDPVGSAVGRELAVHLLLLEPREGAGSIRTMAAALDRSPSSVHAALAAFRADGLMTDDGEPMRGALFEALSRAWRPRKVALAGVPEPGTGSALERAPDLNLFDETRPGWALTDTRAASAWGAPVVASGDYPPDFYVPTRRAFRWAVQHYGAAAVHDQRAATVAVAPVPAVCGIRYDPTQFPDPRDEHYLLAHPLFVALDLARDPGRGREILAAWRPHGPEGFRRVW